MIENRPSALPFFDIDAHPPLAAASFDYIGELNTDSFFSRLARTGIGRVCGTLTPPPGFFENRRPEEAVGLLNESAMQLAADRRDYFPALWVHPACPAFSVAQIEQYAPLGVRMVDVRAEWLNEPGADCILSCAESLDMVVSLRGEHMNQADALAGRFPALRMLVGGLNSTGYMPASACGLLKRHPRLLLNLSGVIWSLNYGLHEWTQRLGADRLFFGSGYPLCNPAAKTAAIGWELRDEPVSVREAVQKKNALALLGAERSPLWK